MDLSQSEVGGGLELLFKDVDIGCFFVFSKISIAKEFLQGHWFQISTALMAQGLTLVQLWSRVLS